MTPGYMAGGAARALGGGHLAGDARPVSSVPG